MGGYYGWLLISRKTQEAGRVSLNLNHHKINHNSTHSNYAPTMYVHVTTAPCNMLASLQPYNKHSTCKTSYLTISF